MRPETKVLYPVAWKLISKTTIAARGNKCERCGRNAEPDICILTVHHIDHNPANNKKDNLKVLCQGCHLALEKAELAAFGPLRNRHNAITQGQLTLPEF
jgi:5-methylcytosine-specific restriction endonuclease McrA